MMFNNKFPLRVILVGIAFVFIIWLLPFFLPIYFSTVTTDFFAASGQFGDMFGAANALFTGMSVCGLLITIFLQIDAIKDQAQQKKFAVLNDLITDLKYDLNNYDYGGRKGYEAFHQLKDELRYGVTISADKFKYPIIVFAMFSSLIDKVERVNLSVSDHNLLCEKILILYVQYLLNLVDQIKLLPSQGFVLDLLDIISHLEQRIERIRSK